MWEVLCGRIVKIFLYEGGDVEQWLEPRNNLGVCDRSIVSKLSLFFISCIALY